VAGPIINFRVLDQNGAGTDSEVIAAIQAAIQLKSTYNIRVINLSLGRPVFESYTLDPLCQAVEQAWKSGIVVVVAAGNYGRDNSAGTYGYGTITAPGNDPYVITVGAMNTMGTADRTDDVIASYSSKGPTYIDQLVKPDIVAPGNLVISLYAAGETLLSQAAGNVVPSSVYIRNSDKAPSGTYLALSGTSMATPVVSGAAALMLQANPALTPDQVKATLMLTAFKNLVYASTVRDSTTGQTFYEQADVFTVGAGLLDVQAALVNTALAPSTVGSAMSPVAKMDANGNVTLGVNGTSVLGGNSILWGSSILWGNSILWGSSSTVAGNSILWGSNAPIEGSSILWGSSDLSGNDAVGGASIIWGSSGTDVDASSVLWGSRR
jgi:serine protease AprX